MVKQPHPSVDLKSKVYIDLGMDLTNKSVLLSLGGYLHAFDGVVNIGGLTTILIDWYKIPFAKDILNKTFYGYVIIRIIQFS